MQQLQRGQRQGVRHGVFRAAIGEGLDGVNHGVNAGIGGGMLGQAQREIGIQDRHVRIQRISRDAAFGGRARGQHRHIGHFRAGARRGGQQDQRRTVRPDLLHAIHRGQGLLAGQKERDHFRRVHRAAAAKADHGLGAKFLTFRHSFEDGAFGRVGDHLVIDMHLKARILQARQRRIGQSRLQDALIGDKEDALGALERRGGGFREPCARARLEQGFGDCREGESGGHGRRLLPSAGSHCADASRVL